MRQLKQIKVVVINRNTLEAAQQIILSSGPYRANNANRL